MSKTPNRVTAMSFHDVTSEGLTVERTTHRNTDGSPWFECVTVKVGVTEINLFCTPDEADKIVAGLATCTRRHN